jgi:hypothetical protein
MANSITTTYPLNGTRNFVARVDIVCDTAAEFTAADIIDVANLTGTPATFKIKSIEWQFSNFYAKLLWDATADVQAVALNQYEGDIDFFKQGAPLINNAGAGVTGKLQITTTGVATTSSGTIFIKGYH